MALALPGIMPQESLFQPLKKMNSAVKYVALRQLRTKSLDYA